MNLGMLHGQRESAVHTGTIGRVGLVGQMGTKFPYFATCYHTRLICVGVLSYILCPECWEAFDCSM